MAAITTLVMAVTLLASCRDARVYDHFEPVNDDGWGRNDTVRFAISRQKSCEVDVNLSLRVNHRFPYRDLSLIVCYETYPSGNVDPDTVQIHVLNEPSAAQPPRQGDATRRPHPQGKPRGERPSREGGQRGEGRQRPMERSSQQPRRSHEKAAETGETQQQRPPMPPRHGEVKENVGGNESK